MREIYNRDPNDPMYKSDIIEITDPIEICMGQLKMCLLTNKGEILGDPSFGMDLDSMLFELSLSESGLRKEMDLHLTTYVPLFYDLGGYYNIQFYQGTERDIVFFDFYIPGYGGNSPVVTLKFT